MSDSLEDPNDANEDQELNEALDEEVRREQERRDQESNLATPDPDVPLRDTDEGDNNE